MTLSRDSQCLILSATSPIYPHLLYLLKKCLDFLDLYNVYPEDHEGMALSNGGTP
jgi:hypothetical protein